MKLIVNIKGMGAFFGSTFSEKRAFRDKNLFSDNVERDSKNLWKMMSAELAGGLSYKLS